MRRFVALSYMVGFPVVLGLAKVVPGVVFALLFAAGGAMSVLLGATVNWQNIVGATTLFGYFVSGFFPAGPISNFIMGL
jgi:hypothetical protein